MMEMDRQDVSAPSEQKTPRYVVITPVRNEAAFIEKTLASMAAQTQLPAMWVIVNDGSSDDTGAIVERWAREHAWMRVVNRDDRGGRKRGRGVIEAFYCGYALLPEAYEFIVKLDGDVSFGRDYFERLLEQFAADPRLGIAGGGIYERPDGQDWALYTSRDHVRGATKVYRRKCFEAIGGLVPAMGWDGIDEWNALALGWKVCSFPEYSIYHYRFTGAATGFLKSWYEQGDGAYRMGYHPLYLAARGLWHMKDRPFVIGGMAMIAAYLLGWLRREDILVEPEVRDFVRRTQMRKLTGMMAGKPLYES